MSLEKELKSSTLTWRRDDIHKNKPLMNNARKVMKSYKGVTLGWDAEEVDAMSDEEVSGHYDDMMRSFEHNTGSMGMLVGASRRLGCRNWCCFTRYDGPMG